METPPVILLAEDDGAIRVMMAEALADEGYDVIACSSGEQAMATLDQLVPSLLLTDLHMESQDQGLLLLHHMREQGRTKDIPAIIYSADSLALRHYVWQCELYNAITIGKPFDLLMLLTTIADLLDERDP